MNEDGTQEAGYGIGAVARRLGVPAATLRTWNLRYGIGPSRRSPGGHRRYGTADLRRLETMSRLVREGMPPAEAARKALRLPGGPPAAPDGVPSAPALVEAALALDSRAVADGLAAALAGHGATWTWQRLVRPVFAAIVDRQAETGGCVDVEHLFSERLLAALLPLGEPPGSPAGRLRPVLLACAEDEQHSLPVHVLAAVLAGEHGVGVRVLGARTPYSALAASMSALDPAVVFVWAQRSVTGDPAPLAALPGPPERIVVGGPGWTAAPPAGIAQVTSLDEAVSRVLAAFR
ncbi:MerR HTH family regulatory protein [Thermomonospora echinospora]|uniref:MerR HTH family regulatory protein n=1 Tax=Thermomonospora echinospora TaxID=1992 RepID=A0A1H5ZU16_9ACTN|nr:MerR family transcriptional regulator [Thermomonospora echinospora]SEG40023.1 MerR HTH family regulatory protein [Thermomonospora echinospora]